MRDDRAGEAKTDFKALRDIPPWDWPADAGETLLGVLRDEHAIESDRMLAASLAGDVTVINDEIALTLLAIVRSSRESDKLRGQAAIALGPILEKADTYGFDDGGDVSISEKSFDTIRDSLRTVFVDASVAKDVRRRVLEGAVRAPQEWHHAAVRDGYHSGDEKWKETAVFCMQYVPGFDEQIVEALQSKDPDVLYEAVCAAGSRRTEAAWPFLSALIQRGEVDKPTLLAAIEAVGAIRPQDAYEVLGDLLESKDEEVLEAVHEALSLAETSTEGAGLDDDFEDDDLELPDTSEAAETKARKVGRNEPCPCGSGKKFKKCCGR